jgi:hypothetical protein
MYLDKTFGRIVRLLVFGVGDACDVCNLFEECLSVWSLRVRYDSGAHLLAWHKKLER